jgi:hypothetical protein
MTSVDWLFSSSDATHTLLDENDSWSSGPPGSALREVVGRFQRGEAPDRVTFGELWLECHCGSGGLHRFAGIPATTVFAPQTRPAFRRAPAWPVA